MKVEDCLPYMSKMYLGRIIDSILKEGVPKGDEKRLREQIIQNKNELESEERINSSLNLRHVNRATRILFEEILTILLELPDMKASDISLYDMIINYEKDIIKRAGQEDAFSYSDDNAIDIYQTVLQVALEDDDINEFEFVLLEKLRMKLKISRIEKRFVETRLKKFPKSNNKTHSLDEFNEALRYLQSRGILFYCNKMDNGNVVVLPDEIAIHIKPILGFEMTSDAQRNLYDKLSSKQLYTALTNQELPVAGSKQEKAERLIHVGTKPSEVLGALQVSDITKICKGLPGVKVSGSKDDKINRIIDFYCSLTNKEPEESKDERAVYYQYFEELAARDNKTLLGLKIIQRDRDMESAFEKATTYMFENKFNREPLQLEGVDHADGAILMKNGELLLWDNKGKESVYKFPKSHINQFKRYIRESTKRVNIFLVIVPNVDRDACTQAARELKYSTDTDTDVAVITASNLKYVAENWTKFGKKNLFDMKVFNYTGVLDRQTLDQQMKLILK
ncbi:MAG: hypothetical protein EA408_02740 [Marinilabiliales bacterium]|nr:MAG: hypothetical protein EA408_02740 [Marinilabiliales bacterium]